MKTIQSTDVNSYVKSLVEKAMDDHLEQSESADTTRHPDKDPQAERNEAAANETNMGS